MEHHVITYVNIKWLYTCRSHLNQILFQAVFNMAVFHNRGVYLKGTDEMTAKFVTSSNLVCNFLRGELPQTCPRRKSLSSTCKGCQCKGKSNPAKQGHSLYLTTNLYKANLPGYTDCKIYKLIHKITIMMMMKIIDNLVFNPPPPHPQNVLLLIMCL